MGYNINYTDLRAFQNTVNLLIEGWKQNLQWVLEDINALINSDSYRGQAADSMRLYLQDVTGNITITLINILCEYSGKLNQYIQGFYAYDNGWQAVLNEDAMQAVMDTFSHIIQETMDSYDRIKDSMDSVSDQLPSSLLTQQAYVVSMIGERDSIYRLRESVGEYDAAAGTEQPTLQEEVETLLQIIKQQVENPPCSVTGYTAEVWQATDTYGDLERIYNASHWYINSHERSILEAQQSYIDTLDRIQEDLSKERWEKGYELVMVSSASALSLVLSSGLLTTGTLTAETAALSTVAAAFVYSDYIEGVQEMYYGCVGDISSASVNPLKDTVFGGWEEGYRTAEMLSIGVASYSGMQDIARAEQAAGDTLGKEAVQESGEAAGREILQEGSETVETIQDSLDVKEEVQTVVADEVKTGIESGRTTVIYGVDDIANYQYNMIENPGPLAEIQGNPAKNFYGGRYNVEVLTEDRIYYRGGNSDKALGQWFTTEPPESVAKVRIDTAVKPQWIDTITGELTGESVVDTVYAIKIPKGTTVYTGPVGSQGGVYCGGYNIMQTFIKEPWKLDYQVISKSSLN